MKTTLPPDICKLAEELRDACKNRDISAVVMISGGEEMLVWGTSTGTPASVRMLFDLVDEAGNMASTLGLTPLSGALRLIAKRIDDRFGLQARTTSYKADTHDGRPIADYDEDRKVN